MNKTIKDMNFQERKEISELLANWLKPYTHEVIVKVMAKREEIINNEFTMMLLKQLKEREAQENKAFLDNIIGLFGAYESYKDYNTHSHAEHSQSYRDVLYDMYIRDKSILTVDEKEPKFLVKMTFEGEEKCAYWRKLGDCFDLVKSRKFASELTQEEADKILAYKEKYLKDYNGTSMEAIEI